MRRKSIIIFLSFILIFSLLSLAACSSAENTATEKSEEAAENKTTENKGAVNIYTTRHYDTDELLFNLFTGETGIKVNVVKADADELLERIEREGADTVADLLFTVDAGRLHKAKEKSLLQPVTSDVLFENIPEVLRDKDNQWFGLTKRARVIVYSLDRVNPSELSTYEDLTDPKWKGKILIRSSENIYNQSLLASFIALYGEEKAAEWAQGIVKNLARTPKGNDRDQAKAIVAGEGDIAIMNTYYVGGMLNSANPEEQDVAKKVGIFFPDQEGAGTHVNVSGVGLTKYAKNKENAIKLIEFLSSEKAQKLFAEANYEYPVNPLAESSNLLKAWGEFKEQDINLSLLGEYQLDAVKIFDKVGWK